MRKARCGLDCCAVSRSGWEFNFADVRAHTDKHGIDGDGDCSCDLCTHVFSPRTSERVVALEACARAGLAATSSTNANMVVNACSASWWDPAAKAIDVAVTEQILSGRYDNAKVAETAFVEAVLAEARRHSVLVDEPGLRRKK